MVNVRSSHAEITCARKPVRGIPLCYYSDPPVRLAAAVASRPRNRCSAAAHAGQRGARLYRFAGRQRCRAFRFDHAQSGRFTASESDTAINGARIAVNTTTMNGTIRRNSITAYDEPLSDLTEKALRSYFAALNGHSPGALYDLVIQEVERPLFRAVMDHTGGNQTQAAAILGINRGTLRKKLRAYDLLA
jgi:Fis family transcriptional regulator, factor for inversion stimulation protein